MLRFRRGERYPSPKTFQPERESDRQKELAGLVGLMGEPIEQALGLKETPNQCLISSLIVAKYLRDEGYAAHAMAAVYTKPHPMVSAEFGVGVAFKTALFAKGLSLIPLQKRSAESFSLMLAQDGESRHSIESLIRPQEDLFVSVKMGEGDDKQHYFIHLTYRQFMPAHKRWRAPEIVFDNLEPRRLKRKYGLTILSPDVQSMWRKNEDIIFSGQEPGAETDPIVAEIRKLFQGAWGKFKPLMDAKNK